jgi:regulator of sigma E protease
VNALLELPSTLGVFVLVLGVLVTVHELGHFVAARLCGVRVLKFSVGFGSPIGFRRWRARWSRGGTEYVVAWIPLGGFVKMLGENPGEEDSPAARADRAHALPGQPLWKKVAISFAGPFVNLLLPVLVFVIALGIGLDRPAPVISTVERGSPAEAAGILPGDRILAVDGDAVVDWLEADAEIREHAGDGVRLSLARAGETREVEIAAQARSGVDATGTATRVGWIGVHHERQIALLAIPDPASPAARAGLRSGDRVVSVDGAQIEAWHELSAAYAAASGEVALRVKRGTDEAMREIDVRAPALGTLSALGATTAVIVSEVVAGSPAARAGLAVDDLLVAVDGHTVTTFQNFRDAVQASEGRPLEVVAVRAGERKALRIAPEKMRTEIAPGAFEDVYRVGITGAAGLAPGVFEEQRILNPFVAIPRAVEMTLAMTTQFLKGLSHIFAGRVSRDAIGGPIEIARQSKLAWDLGWQSFMTMLVLISINLGILNLLPIPVLDGGQIVMYTLEAVLRDRFTLRAREIAQTVGFALLLTLMMFALYNDFTKHVIGFFRDL